MLFSFMSGSSLFASITVWSSLASLGHVKVLLLFQQVFNSYRHTYLILFYTHIVVVGCFAFRNQLDVSFCFSSAGFRTFSNFSWAVISWNIHLIVIASIMSFSYFGYFNCIKVLRNFSEIIKKELGELKSKYWTI